MRIGTAMSARYLLDENNEALEHVLDFTAHLVQRPKERIAHALLLTSDAKGIGKSSLGKVIHALVGEQNSRVAQTKDLKGLSASSSYRSMKSTKRETGILPTS
jgi:phage/plasmid-associated DNA primase